MKLDLEVIIMRINRSSKLILTDLHIGDFFLMVSIIVGCRSVFMQANPYFGYTFMIVSTILAIVGVGVRRGIQLSKKAITVWLIYLIIVGVVTVMISNTSNGYYIISFWIIVPIMLLYFLMLTYDEKMDWLKRFSNLLFIFIVLSTISWLIGPILHLIKPTHEIQLEWGGYRTYYGYFLCYKRTDRLLKSYLGITFPSNSSIFVEATITNVIYTLGYVLHLFVNKDKSKIKEAIYLIAMITTMSASSFLLAVAIFAVGRIVSYRENPSKGSLHFLFTRLIIPVLFIAVAFFAMRYILVVKSDDDYGNYYAHTYAIASGFNAWLTKPMTGYGYELGQQFYNTTSGFFKILVHGGVVFAFLYILPLVSSLNFARKQNDFGLAAFVVIAFVLLIAVIWHYSPAYMFILAFEYSFMNNGTQSDDLAIA